MNRMFTTVSTLYAQKTYVLLQKPYVIYEINTYCTKQLR